MNNTVDVLMGTYNGSRFLRDQIESLQSQTHENWNLYIRDDLSKDSTPALIAEIAGNDPRIQIIKDSKGNIGFNENYHCLLAHARSDYIMFCDQDDHWRDMKIAKTLQCMRETESARGFAPILVHCESTVVNVDMKPVANRFIGKRAFISGLPSVLMANPAQGATIMINRALLNLLLRCPPRLPYDYKAALIAEATGYRCFLPEPMLLYRQHGSNAIGASGAAHPPPSHAGVISSTLKLGFDAASSIEATLREVRDQWHPSTAGILQSHMHFIKPGFSLMKAIWIMTHRYGFYRRSDYIYAILHSLGLKKI